MSRDVDDALAVWDLTGAAYRLVAARENAVYEVTNGPTRVALRLHRKGYRSDTELRSELDWMAALARAGLSVPAPVPARDGRLLHTINGVRVDVLLWLQGQTLQGALEGLRPEAHAQVFRTLGQDMARLHAASDTWDPPQGFTRPHWNREGLLGEAPLWDRFWANPALDAPDHELFRAFRHYASDRLSQLGPTLDYGLIHADLVPANVMVDGAALHLIDFDDGGFGYRLFDVATTLLKHLHLPHFSQVKTALLEGYHSTRPLDVTELDLFLALRAATYVGWNITRMDEDGGHARNARFIATLRQTATRVLPA
ncbi:homoserine kinase [Jannaschia sp. CCS1]|uniref:homoserine kinase n=1 Tax=Jannaschia sp. (strain CCS1) TaxID=290400 RepID=UPI000053C6C9|nr:homoserine kinase [Jannaschia sp. CCS1]ABD54293.1 aminoglycoside phosphotransferase [Jannaschia sp. CCS1]